MLGIFLWFFWLFDRPFHDGARQVKRLTFIDLAETDIASIIPDGEHSVMSKGNLLVGAGCEFNKNHDWVTPLVNTQPIENPGAKWLRPTILTTFYVDQYWCLFRTKF